MIGDLWSARLKPKLKSLHLGVRQKLVARFRSYGRAELRRAIERLGIQSGDTLMVHAGHSRLSGFTGRPADVVETLLETVGTSGNLVMVSMPYTSSAYEYLKQRKPFDVRKTVSHMGMVSESFRRRDGVLRSLHPSNPVLAFGPRARWIVEGHESCRYPCGAGSPFEKLAELRAKVLFLDASIYTQTFFHYLEDLVESQLDFPLFRDELVDATVIDYDGRARIVQTYTYSDVAIHRRRPSIMVAELERLKLIKRARVGNSRILRLRTEDVVRVVKDMASRGVYFYSK